MNSWSRVFLIALRLVIGWHFLYEGLHKVDSDTGAVTYSTAHYALQSSTDGLRAFFAGSEPPRREAALARVDAWHDSSKKAFAAQKQLDEEQKARLAGLRDEIKLAAIEAIEGRSAITDVVNFDWEQVHETVLKIAPEPQSERFSSVPYLQNSTGPLRGVFRGLVPDVDGLERLTVESARARIEGRHAQILAHYGRSGHPLTPEQQAGLASARDTIQASVQAILESPQFRARLEDYRQLRSRVASDARGTNGPFTRERLAADRAKLDASAAELLTYVNEPLSELAVQTRALLTPAQMAAGPLPAPKDPAAWIDTCVKVSLVSIGICLILGLFTPAAALAAAGQLAVFYLASPPWPGLPAASTGGHFLYVDRNLIELVAALVIASTASGRWAGLDYYLHRRFSSVIRRSRPARVQTREEALQI